jgi:uncharacterized repeat protein (TIGR02059 family)
MNLKPKVGLGLALALVGTGLPLLAASTASASGNGSIQTTGSCADILNLREQNVGDLKVTITVPSADPTETWTLTAQQQDYNAVTGGRQGNPVDIVPNPMPPLVFNSAEGGFSTTADFPDTSGLTHGYSYTATRTSPTPLTCTNQAFWTTPSNQPGPVVPPNPIGKPDTPPALTGATEADSGSNSVLLQFDQEMLDTAQGIPANGQFSIQVNGVARTVTGVQVINDSPPADSVVDVTFDGAALASGQTVTVNYRKPLTASAPHLQDLDGNPVASFGPISVPTF